MSHRSKKPVAKGQGTWLLEQSQRGLDMARHDLPTQPTGRVDGQLEMYDVTTQALLTHAKQCAVLQLRCRYAPM